jgi:uncharacterized protein (TIGR02217 family)
MSYPTLTLPISMASGLQKSPNFNTLMKPNAAARGNYSVALKPYPTWDFTFDSPPVQGNEADASSVAATFLGTYMACQGHAGLFLFTDPQDSTVNTTTGVMLNVTSGAASPMGQKGDGSSTQFQLARLIGGTGVDLLQNINGSIDVYVNGVQTTAFSLSSTGVVTFTSAPASNATIEWSGSFYFLCRFAKDSLDAIRSFTSNNGTDLWKYRSIEFSSEFV